MKGLCFMSKKKGRGAWVNWVPYLSYPNQLQSSTFTLVISQTDFLPGLILACLVWFGVAVVQWVGHRSFNREVPCSIPGGLR